MPEGIEIASISIDLSKNLVGKILEKIEISKYYLQRIKNYDNFFKLFPLEIKNIFFKGKIIIFDLGTAFFTSQLGMTGRWSFQKNISHIHLKLYFKNNLVLYYSDIRRFGMIYFYCGNNAKELLENRLNKLAPDFLSKYFCKNYKENFISKKIFIERLNKSRSNLYVANLLMNQEKICSGVGNYILSELFYRCKLNPFIKIYDLFPEDKINIYRELKKIMKEGLKYKGNSIQDFFNLDGTKGKYQNFLQVYMKNSDPLGNMIVKQEGPHKRSVHWVPIIQKRKLRIKIITNFTNKLTNDFINKMDFGINILVQPYKKDIIYINNIDNNIVNNNKINNKIEKNIEKNIEKYNLLKTSLEQPHLILYLDVPENNINKNKYPNAYKIVSLT